MQYSFDGSNPSDPTMEYIECCVVPSSKPKEDIIPARKEPKEREVGRSEDPSTIREVYPDLPIARGPAVASSV